MDGERMIEGNKILLTVADCGLFVSHIGRALDPAGTVVLVVGDAAAVMTAGEWSRLIANPKHADILNPEASS